MLFCKPSRKAGVLYEQALGKGQTLTFRSLNPKTDLPVIQHCIGSFDWNEFWNFPIQRRNVLDIYTAVQKNPKTHAIISQIDGQLICLIDLTMAEASDLGKHIVMSTLDCIARFIFIQPLILQKVTIVNFLSWYFAFPESGQLYTIPGIQDHNYCRLLETAGFTFFRNCILTEQAVSIYQIKNYFSVVKTQIIV